MTLSRFVQHSWAVLLLSVLAVLVLGQPVGAQTSGEWVLSEVSVEPEGGAPPDSWTVNSISETSMSLTVDWEEGYRGTYEFSWSPLPPTIPPGDLTVSAKATASIEREGSQSYTSTGIAMTINGDRVLLVPLELGCGQANGATGPIVCSGPQEDSDDANVPIEAGGLGDTLVVVVFSGRCGCTVQWTYEWQGPAVTSGEGTTDDGTSTGQDTSPGSGPATTTPTAAEPSSQAGNSLITPAADEVITPEEAIAASIVMILIAVGMGWLTLAEAGLALRDLLGPGGADRAADLLGSNDSPGPVSEAPPRPATSGDGPTPEPGQTRTPGKDPLTDWSPQRLDRLAQQGEDFLIDDLGRSLPVIPMMEELDAVRDRIAAGTATPSDLERLRSIRDVAATANEFRRSGDEDFRQRVDQMLEWAGFAQQAGLVGGKGLAGAEFGPAVGGIVTAVVDTVSNREHGWDRAALIGVTNGAIDSITGGLSDRLRALALGSRVSGGALLNGLAAAGQSYLEQFIANGGNASAIDMDQVYRAGEMGAGFGAVFGTAGDDVRVPGSGTPDAPPTRLFDADGAVPRSGTPDVPQTTRMPDAPPVDVTAPTAPQTRPVDVTAPTAPQTRPVDVTAPTAAQTPPVDVTAPTAAQTPPVDVTAPTAAQTPPVDATAPTTPQTPPVDATAPTTPQTPPVDVTAPTVDGLEPTPMARSNVSGEPAPPPRGQGAQNRWREFDADGAGNVYDRNGNHLYTLDSEGDAITMDGRQVRPLVDGDGPVGYVDAEGRMIAFDAQGRPQLIENRVPGQSRVEVQGEWTTLEELGFEPNWIEGGARMTPLEGVPRAVTTPRNYLPPDIRSRWAGVGAGPNGELYGQSGSVFGRIDSNGRMWTEGGDEIVSYSRQGNRIVSIRTPDGTLIATE